MKRVRPSLFLSCTAVLTMTALATGCDGDPEDPCPFADISGTTITPGGDKVACTQATFGNNSLGASVIGLRLSSTADVVVSLFIENLNPADGTSSWPLVLEADEANFPWTLQVQRSSQGTATGNSLCKGIAEGSTVRIDNIAVDPSKANDPFGFISTLSVTFDATLTGCTVSAWGLTDADLPLKGVAMFTDE